MDFGVSRSDATFVGLVEDALWAEEQGLVAICVGDHLLQADGEDPARAAVSPVSDPFVHLAGLAVETSRIQLGLTMASVTFRHPAIVLKSAIDIDIMSGGRFMLGVGAGYRETEHRVFGIPFPGVKERFRMLEEYLSYLRAGLTQPNPGYSGSRFALEAHPVCPSPLGQVRLLVGGGGPRMTPRIAARYADEYNLFPMPRDAIESRISAFRSERSIAGRGRDQFVLSAAGPIISGENQAEYWDALSEHAAGLGIGPDELDRRHRERGRMVGTYDEVGARVADLEAAGVSRFYVVFEGAFNRERFSAFLSAMRSG